MSTITNLGGERLRRKVAALPRRSPADYATGIAQDLNRLVQDGGGDGDQLAALAERALRLAALLRGQLDAEHEPASANAGLTTEREPLSAAEALAAAEVHAAAFWRCRATGVDCRRVQHPALAVVAVNDPAPGQSTCQFQMYANPDLADAASFCIIEAPHGVGAAYLLDTALHLGEKSWVDRAALLEAVDMIAWERGDRTWAGAHGMGPFARLGAPVVHRRS